VIKRDSPVRRPWTFGQPLNTMKGKHNGQSGRLARNRNERDAIETFPKKRRHRPRRPTGPPTSISASYSHCDDSNQAVGRAVDDNLLGSHGT
jgi:hypothetical protein